MKFRFRITNLLPPILLITLVFITSCENDDTPLPPPSQAGQDGYFIVNEGGFGNANTSLSYYDRQQDTVLNNVFRETNNRPLGDQTQSMTVFDNRGFIVVQNSGKVEVINAETFESLATIGEDEGIVSPRYFVGVSPTKGYLTDWGADGVSGTVKVIDLVDYVVSSTIAVGAGPNNIIYHEDRLYIANGGGLGSDSTIAVIDPQTDTVIKKIEVGNNPSSLAVDANGSIWVASGGKLVYDPVDFSIVESESTPGFVARLDREAVTLMIPADAINVGPGSITIDPSGQLLYFRYRGALYSMSIENTTLPTTPLVDQGFYGLGVDPVSGEILTGEAPNFSSAGRFSRFSSTGNFIQSYKVGIAPNGFAF